MGWLFYIPELIVVFILVLITINWTLSKLFLSSHGKPTIMIILGSGGHTGEMINFVERLDLSRFSKIFLAKALSDKTSYNMFFQALPQWERASNNESTPLVIKKEIPRAREVMQSYFTSIFTTLYAFLHALVLMYREKPDLVVTNGPGTCIPLCFAQFFNRMTMRSHGKILFIESICRVKSLSMTGTLLYPLSDRTYVQHKTLQMKYPGSILLDEALKKYE